MGETATDAELAECREWINHLRARGAADDSPVVQSVGMVEMLLDTIDKAHEDAAEDCALLMRQRNEAIALLRQVSDIANDLGRSTHVAKDINAWLMQFDARVVTCGEAPSDTGVLRHG